MIKLEYTEADSETGITKNSVVTFDGGQLWQNVLEEFFHFLNTCGYVIDQPAISEMVGAAVDVHDKHLGVKWPDMARNQEMAQELAEPSEWKFNGGEELPPGLKPTARVTVICRNYEVMESEEVGDLDWTLTDVGGDIIRYKVLSND